MVKETARKSEEEEKGLGFNEDLLCVSQKSFFILFIGKVKNWH